jgi:hypothetical protein
MSSRKKMPWKRNHKWRHLFYKNADGGLFDVTLDLAFVLLVCQLSVCFLSMTEQCRA